MKTQLKRGCSVTYGKPSGKLYSCDKPAVEKIHGNWYCEKHAELLKPLSHNDWDFIWSEK